MRFDIALGDVPSDPSSLRVGNVYSVGGGRNLRRGAMWIVLAITEAQCQFESTNVVCVLVNRDGDIMGGTRYAPHYFENKTPIAFVEGLDDLSFTIGPLR